MHVAPDRRTEYPHGLQHVYLHDRRQWIGGIGPFFNRPNAPTECINCVTRSAEVELEVMQSHFDFYFYPSTRT